MTSSYPHDDPAGQAPADPALQVPADPALQVPADPALQVPADPAAQVPAGGTGDADAAAAPDRAGGLLTGIATAWHAVTDWRRRRPFWGGLLLLGAGAELLMIPLPVHAMGLILHIGTGGVLGILIGAILIVCGLLLWFNPAQRIFYSIVAVLLAVAALVASNLGGFLIGTLLGVVGGSLGFAWTPGQPGRAGRGSRRRPRRPAGQPGGLGTILGARHKADPASTDPASTSRATIRGYAVLPLAVVTLAALVQQSPAAGARSSLCLPGLPPIPILNPCPSPSPSHGGGADPSGSPRPTPGVSGSTSPSPTPSGSASPSDSPSPSPGASTPDLGGSPSPSPTPRTGTPPAFAVATAPSTLTAKTALISGFAYDGVVTVRTTSGTVRLMQFSMTSLSLTTVNLTTRQDGQAITTTAPTLSLSGHVTLYASELSGDLLGVPISITPGSPLATILAAIAPLTKAVPVPMTNVVTDQPFTSASGMSVSGLAIS